MCLDTDPVVSLGFGPARHVTSGPSVHCDEPSFPFSTKSGLKPTSQSPREHPPLMPTLARADWMRTELTTVVGQSDNDDKYPAAFLECCGRRGAVVPGLGLKRCFAGREGKAGIAGREERQVRGGVRVHGPAERTGRGRGQCAGGHRSCWTPKAESPVLPAGQQGPSAR